MPREYTLAFAKPPNTTADEGLFPIFLNYARCDIRIRMVRRDVYRQGNSFSRVPFSLVRCIEFDAIVDCERTKAICALKRLCHISQWRDIVIIIATSNSMSYFNCDISVTFDSTCAFFSPNVDFIFRIKIYICKICVVKFAFRLFIFYFFSACYVVFPCAFEGIPPKQSDFTFANFTFN